jgi:uncharacterized protein YaiE (UPF0345 family)
MMALTSKQTLISMPLMMLREDSTLFARDISIKNQNGKQTGETMFKTNEYFDGKVKSIAFENTEGPATIGVMAPGDYEFGTSTVEYMTVVSGQMSVKLPDTEEWKVFKAGQTFIVEKDKKFQLQISQASAYLCVYK